MKIKGYSPLPRLVSYLIHILSLFVSSLPSCYSQAVMGAPKAMHNLSTVKEAVIEELYTFRKILG